MNKSELLSNYFTNLRTDLYTVQYGRCSPEWRDMDYTPDYSKFYLICDGEGWLRIGGKEYYPRPGQLFIMPEGVKRSYSCISAQPFLKYWCHFSAKLGEINLFKVLECKHYIDISDFPRMQNIFKELQYYFHNDQFCSKMMAKAKLFEVISCFFTEVGMENIDINHRPQMDQLKPVLDYINVHLQDELVVPELAKIIYVQPNYFIRLFSKNLGISPIQYINRKRIEKAKEILTSTGCTASEVGKLVGFQDLFYFLKVFKKIVGVTPTEFRSSNSWA